MTDMEPDTPGPLLKHMRAQNAALRDEIMREIMDLPQADLRGVLRMIDIGTSETMMERFAALTAERDRLRAKLADAAAALDAAGMELSDFANCLSREPWAACLAYEAAIAARAALKGESHE